MSSTSPYAAWYKTPEWRAIRKQAFERDKYICQRTGKRCWGKYPAANSPTANHKIPHRGDKALFFDINNVETVMKKVHDSEIQREEQGSLNERGVWY